MTLGETSPPLSSAFTPEHAAKRSIRRNQLFDVWFSLVFLIQRQSFVFFLLSHFQLESGELPQQVVYQIYFIYILGGRQDYSILIPFLC